MNASKNWPTELYETSPDWGRNTLVLDEEWMEKTISDLNANDGEADWDDVGVYALVREFRDFAAVYESHGNYYVATRFCNDPGEYDLSASFASLRDASEAVPDCLRMRYASHIRNLEIALGEQLRAYEFYMLHD